MKTCPNCNAQLNDDAVFCNNCGNSVQGAPNQNYTSAYPTPTPAPVVKQTDHTAEFAPADVAENKLFALLTYLMSIVGVIIALLANLNNKSDYLKFHIKQSLKIFICESIVAVITAVLFWTCIIPFAGAVASIILLVVTVICFIQTCRNKSIEAPIINGLGFLK
jgi:uncharacterized membrane protein